MISPCDLTAGEKVTLTTPKGGPYDTKLRVREYNTDPPSSWTDNANGIGSDEVFE